MEENLKSIKLLLDYYDEDGNHSLKEMSVKLNKPKDLTKGSYLVKAKNYSMSFSLVIPNHIHSYLIGKSTPNFYSNSMRNDFKTYEEDFSKTINSETIEGICRLYLSVVSSYIWLKELEKSNLEKVIFYKFKNESGVNDSRWNGDNIGVKSKLSFYYSVGYISKSKHGILRYNVNKKLINEAHEREFYQNNHVSWSEERQLFFDNMQKSFESIIDKIDKFQDGLSEDTINEMISTTNILLSN